jgi:hypothetical protein
MILWEIGKRRPIGSTVRTRTVKSIDRLLWISQHLRPSTLVARRGRKMTQELDKRIKELCKLIIKKKDSLLFQELVMELNQRLEERDKILDRRLELISKQRDQLLETSSPTFRPDN